MSFALHIKALTEKYRGDADKVVRYISLTAFSSVILRSPVDTGRFRGNWQCSIGSVPTGVLEGTDKGGGTTLMKAEGVVKQMKAGDTIYLANNLPYALPLEYGSSQQAPQGMVRKTLAEITASLRGTAV